MEILDFSGQPMAVGLTSFAAGAALVWFAGTRLARYAAEISDRTGLGQAMIGLILLAVITSLPEVATSVTAALAGNAELAVNNLLGGASAQVAVLAVGDAAFGAAALSAIVAHPIVLLQGALSALLLVAVGAGVLLGDVAVAGVGLWSAGVLALYVACLWLVNDSRGEIPWVPDHGALQEDGEGEHDARQPGHEAGGGRQRAEAAVERGGGDRTPALPRGSPGRAQQPERHSTARLALRTAAAAAGILAGGFVVARSGEALAEQTGLGSSFVGVTLVAVATSLPELSTVLESVRLRRYEMAFSDIFGTNMVDLSLVFLVDPFYPGPPVLNEVGRFAAVAALLGVSLTMVYIAGLLERRDRRVLRMGVDSLVVLVLYAAGVAALYRIR